MHDPMTARRLSTRTRSTVDGCLEWTGAKNFKGYGIILIEGRGMRAHRVAWEIANNTSIPEGMLVCHHCDNPACVNPEHLFIGSHLDNNRDRNLKGRSAKKLTDDDVREIRLRVANGESRVVVAADYGVHPRTITKIFGFERRQAVA